MQSLHTFRVRDVRRSHYFTIDNKLIDEYMLHIGASAYAVYSYLCRCANKEQESFPGQDVIGEKLGMSRQTVNEKLQVLAAYNLIAITHVKEERTGQQLNNIYTLIDRSDWKPVSENPTRTDVGKADTAYAETRVGKSDTYIYKENNKTHIEKNLEIPNDLDSIPHEAITDPTLKKRNEKRARKGSGGLGNTPAGNRSPYKDKSRFPDRPRGGVDYSDVI